MFCFIRRLLLVFVDTLGVSVISLDSLFIIKFRLVYRFMVNDMVILWLRIFRELLRMYKRIEKKNKKCDNFNSFKR